MRIVYCHNYYRHRGGEDISFDFDLQMLRDEGHEVIPFTRSNNSLDGTGAIGMALNTLWNRQTYSEMLDLLRKSKVDIVHCNNLFPQISVSIYHAAQKMQVPVVQALRNYRMHCVNSFFFRNNTVCTKCLNKSTAWNALVHRCYRDSLSASAVVVSMQLFHRLFRIQRRYVRAFVTPTAFARDIHVRGGMSPESVFVRQNFLVDDPGYSNAKREYALYVGRLSPEKGVDRVIQAWREHPSYIPLQIIGSGPDLDSLKKLACGDSRIQFLGEMSSELVLQHLGRACFLVMPSLWYETFGRTIIEALSRGVPVIASRLGAMAELVQEGTNGFLFEPGDATSLGKAVDRCMSLDVESTQRLRTAARENFVHRFSRQTSYRQLLDVYRFALNDSSPALSDISHARGNLPCISN